MKKLYIILTLILFVTASKLQAQNDTIFYWKSGVMAHKQSIKPADLDSITFKRPVVTSPYPAGSVFCASGATTIVDVTNPATGKTWMDRNLGATRVALSSTDANSYGDLYQWGRRSDGHQCRTSATTTTLSAVDQPANGNFILSPTFPFDWRSPQNNNLWQGVNGINNPCPSGYRLPTDTELNAERASWSSNNAAGAFASVLKLPLAGVRDLDNGSLFNVGSIGIWSSSTVSSTSGGILAGGLVVRNNNIVAQMSAGSKASGTSVRCIKN
jgi:uncharacterized protein (TIGR02145 family)